MKLENVMINNGKVTLVGFGKAVKIEDSMSDRSVTSSTSSYDFTFHEKSVEQVKQSIAGPFNDVACIFYMMISELLKNNFSAFNHDEDLDEIIVIDP